MKHTTLIFVFLVGIILPMNSYSTVAQFKNSATNQDERKAQETAREFVKRIQETRDVSKLINEMFLPDFISHFVSDEEVMPTSLYLRLTHKERLRLFVAQVNTSYLQSIDVLWKTDRKYSGDENEFRSALKSILPDALAKRVRNTLFKDDDKLKFTDYQDFQLRIPEVEKVLEESRRHLIKQDIEQTPKFQKELNNIITGKGINYRVRAYIGGDNIKECEHLAEFPATQKFYRVETPLFLGVILVKIKNQMKIARITIVDGD